MKIRKISASYIFAGKSGFLKNGILNLCEDGRVLSLDDTKGKLAEEANLEHYNGILCPGFVNAHCHLELSHMRGKIPRNTGLNGFVEKIIPGRKAQSREISKSIEDADREMQLEGIVAVADICNSPDTFETKSLSPIHYQSFIELFGTAANAAESIYRNGQSLVQEARQKYSLNAGITPHSSYSLGEELFRLIREGMTAKDVLISVHNQESTSEDELISGASGDLYNSFYKLGFDLSSIKPRNMSSFEWLMNQIPKNIRTLLVHNIYTAQKDILLSLAENKDIYWVLCPKSNVYIGGVYPRKYLMDTFPDRICIGTDSLASNDKLSILEELFLLQSIYPEISLSELLLWASENGSKALGINDWYGSFESGKKPGVLLLENVDLQNLQLKKESRVRVLE